MADDPLKILPVEAVEKAGKRRERLRRFFEVDAESTVIAPLYALAEKGQLDPGMVSKAIKELGVDPEKVFPQIVT